MALCRVPQQPRSSHRQKRGNVPALGGHRQALAYLRARKGGRMSRAKKALIVGGGVAGPVAAMALRQAGIDSVVYEAYAGGTDDAGSFLTFASNGLDALRTIDAHHLVLSEGFPTPRMTIQNGTGKHLGDVLLGGTLPDGTVSQTLKRADLYRALRDEAVRRGARVEYGKRLVDAETTPGGVTARFEDGTAPGASSIRRRHVPATFPCSTSADTLATWLSRRSRARSGWSSGSGRSSATRFIHRARSGGSPTLLAPTNPRARSSPPSAPSSGGRC